MYILLIIAGFIIWCLFYAKHHGIGKFIYETNNALERRAAKLIHVKQSNGDEEYSYFTNHQPTKPPMLLLHGFSADKTIWFKYAKLAGKDYNLFIPDLMGHGDIAFDDKQNYSAFEQANYVRRFINTINVSEPINIVGNSMGGMIAAILSEIPNAEVDIKDSIGNKDSIDKSQQTEKEIALMQPININKLVLIDPAGAKTDLALQLAQNDFNPFSHDTVNDSIAFYETAMHKPPFIPPAVKIYIAHTHYLSKKEELRHMFTDFFNPDEFFDNTINTSAKKVILIWGKEDALLPVSDAQHWEKWLACKASILSDIGHMPMVECPQQTYSLIH